METPCLQSRILGCALGACVGDALGMPLEFGPRRPLDAMVREMQPGRLPPGSFTDDTEMALALLESLVDKKPLDPIDLVMRYLAWYQSGPPDVGIQTSSILSRIGRGEPWTLVGEEYLRRQPDAAGNGSIMRCWPVALAYPGNLEQMLLDTALQSQVTHPHQDCVESCKIVNAVIFHLFANQGTDDALESSIEVIQPAPDIIELVNSTRFKNREQLKNSGWVRHTLESSLWGLLTTDSFEEALIQVVNLGGDADTAGAVTGALAGAAYGIESIPKTWIDSLRGEWPIRSGRFLRAGDISVMALRLADLSS